MLKQNKGKIILSTLLTLLPILTGLMLWNRLPDTMATHWGANGDADGFSSKAFAVFGMPVFLAALHLLCLFVTSLDKKQADQNKKALELVFWIVPVISVSMNAIVYSTALGKEPDVSVLLPVLMGLGFVCIGNYLPKVKQNHTLGIRISWTLGSEENWNKTHRFAGKLWVLGGIAILLTVFLSGKWTTAVLLGIVLVLAGIPMAYSYGIYKKTKKDT